MINYLLLSLLIYHVPFQKGKILHNNYNITKMNQLLFFKNLTRIKRYNNEYYNKWQQEDRQKDQELIVQYFRFENASQEEKKKFHYFRIPRVMRQTWIYEHYGRLVGFGLAIIMALVHHFFACIYASVVWLYRRHKFHKNAGDLFVTYPRRSKYYEELQRWPPGQVHELMEMVQSKTEETILDAAEKEFQELLTNGINEQQPPLPKEEKVSECIVEGIIPFDQIGILGPYGERIIENTKPLRDPLPDEKPPIIFEIDEMPDYLITEQQGFFKLIDLVKNQTVIIKTYRTADGYLKGYFGGRFIEDKK